MKNRAIELTLSFVCSAVFFAACDTPPDDTSENRGVEALLDGEVIFLAEDWQDATDCIVWEGLTECFRNSEDAQDLLREIDGPDSITNPSATYACSRQCLHLYEHTSFKGRHLTFCDRGYWQNLGNYGFNDKLSSFKTGIRGVHLAKHSNGTAPWYPGDTSVCISSGGMKSGWNDEVSSLYIK
jgi:hypothetical protein